MRLRQIIATDRLRRNTVRRASGYLHRVTAHSKMETGRRLFNFN